MVQIVGTSTMKCKHKTDYCYNATADLTKLNEISIAGCATIRCLNLTFYEKVKERAKDFLEILGF
ncbi:hypothetical protein ANCDUO_05893 [Ancylostoma duodenale]|uniref:Uncharacterized protein n=1 Tax=Ancylostoma duodenale TaxID=51022 RepID=A0A0C2D2Z9_9BILA|nr:hypothetical protein ANCDUO_05893 [Ancylostoma duodenale]